MLKLSDLPAPEFVFTRFEREGPSDIISQISVTEKDGKRIHNHQAIDLRMNYFHPVIAEMQMMYLETLASLKVLMLISGK